ncbi:MAG: LTA synthase family protein [Hespellia sp.]|nr:LTA synthase family protein [Hespellia sp.]
MQKVTIIIFLKEEWRYLLAAFGLAVASSALMCIPLIQPCMADYGELFFSYTVICALWTGIYLLCAVFPAFLWLGRYGIFSGFFTGIFKKKKQQDRRQTAVRLLRLAIACFGLYEIMTYHRFSMRVVIISIFRNRSGAYLQFLLGLVFFVILLTDWKKAAKAFLRWDQKYPWMLKSVLVLFVSFMGFFIIEMFCESKMLTYMDMRFLNICYWGILLLFLYLIFRQLKISAVITLVTAYVLGLANYLVVMFRGNEILWGDIQAAGTAMEVVDNYSFKPDQYFPMVTIAFVLSVLVILVLPLKEKRQKVDKKRVIQTLISEALLIAVLLIANVSGVLYGFIQGNYWDYTAMMTNTGYIPYFISNVNYSASVKLENYSASSAKKTLEKSSALLGDDAAVADTSAEETAQAPNIIMIMDEAFSDLAVNGDLETNQDYMPFIHNMEDNTIKGYLHLSICGAPTANTEFEVLTRSSMAFLPVGSIPYNQYVTSKIPSLASVLANSEDEYQTFAYHSYSCTGYNRPKAYDFLGFDDSLFVEEEDMDAYEAVRGYVSDASDFKKLEEIYEEKKDGNPLFLFNVTMQNHGGYMTYFDQGEDAIEVTNFDADYQLENYLTLIKKSDNAVKELVTYFQKEEEPTMIIFFGDHQPKLADEILEPFMADSGSDEAAADGSSRYTNVSSRYEVPFFIWTNYDIKEQQNVDISANYLSSYVLEHAGIPLTSYDDFLLELRQSYPILTAKEYWDADGNVMSWDGEKPSAISSYENIQYNCLFDKDHKLSTFFNGTGD